MGQYDERRIFANKMRFLQRTERCIKSDKMKNSDILEQLKTDRILENIQNYRNR